MAFLFDAERRGINDTVRLPPLRGHWVDARCVFTDTHCWLLVATQVQGKIVHQCVLLSVQGTVEATAQAEQHDGSWLGTLRGKGAAGAWLLHRQMRESYGLSRSTASWCRRVCFRTPNRAWIVVVTCLPASRGCMSSTGRTFMYLPLPRQEVE